MATKTFSSRADAEGLAYAEAVVREEFGMSFGQYCGSVLIDAVLQGVELPKPSAASTSDVKARAIAAIKSIAKAPHDPSVGMMSDEQIKNLIASRYE